MYLLIKLIHGFIPLSLVSVTVTIFLGHTCVKRSKLKDYFIEFKLYVNYVSFVVNIQLFLILLFLTFDCVQGR